MLSKIKSDSTKTDTAVVNLIGLIPRVQGMLNKYTESA